MGISSSLVHEIAPTGTLRTSLNMGNPVLAHSKTSTEKPAGVSIDLAREFARELGVEASFLEFDTAALAVTAMGDGIADAGFMAIDPQRGQTIHFTDAYVEIEGAYLVPQASQLIANEQVDQAGHTIVVGAGSAYQLYLSRNIVHAKLFQVPTSETVVATMVAKDLGISAGVKQQMQADAQRVPGMRLLPGRFMVIRQAMCMPRGRSAQAEALMDDFIERMKRSGFVSDALSRHGIQGATVAAAK